MKLLANQLRVSKPAIIPDSRGTSLEQMHDETDSTASDDSMSLADMLARVQSSSHMAMIVSTTLVHCGGIFTEPPLSLAALLAFAQQKKQFTPRRRRERGPPWS